MVSGETVRFDTSVVMRFLAGSPIAQYRAADKYLSSLTETNGTAEVSDLVLSEAYFAIQNFYDFSKPDALLALKAFAETPGISVTPHALETLCIANLSSAKPGFVDRLIHGESHSTGHTLVTFEKAAKKLPNTHILSS